MSDRLGRRGLVPFLLVAAALALVVIGCGADAADITSVGAPVGDAATADPLLTIRDAHDGSALLADDGSSLRVLDPATAAERFAVPGGVSSGDGTLVLGAETSGAATTVLARSTLDGSTRWSTTVDGALEVVGASRGGETVALVDPSAPAGTTSFVVVRFDVPHDPLLGEYGLALPPVVTQAPFPSSQRFDVPGRLEFDGFADTTGGIFVLQRSDADADAYRVRWLDLTDGTVYDMINREKEIPEGEMYGRYRAAVTLPARGEIATVYTVDGSGSSGAAFVHLLNTRGSYADCLDLPAPLGAGDPSTLAIAAPPDGTPLYVQDTHAGAVAVLDPDVIGSVVTVPVPALAGSVDRPAAIAVAGSGQLVLAADDDVVVVDPASGIAKTTWPAGGAVTGLAAVTGTATVAAIVDGEARIFYLDGRPVDAGAAVDPSVSTTSASSTSTAPAPSGSAPTTTASGASAPAVTVPTPTTRVQPTSTVTSAPPVGPVGTGPAGEDDGGGDGRGS